jgi:hypothetical protein
MTDPKPFVSTDLSSAEEHDAGSCVEGSDDDEKVNTAPKVRAPFVAEASEDLESGSAASKSPIKARKATDLDSFRHEFD